MEDKDLFNPKKVLAEAVDTLTEKPLVFEKAIIPKTRKDKLMMFLRLKPKKTKYTIYPINPGNFCRYSVLAMQMPKDILSGNIEECLNRAGAEQMDKFIHLAAIGIQNSPEEPTQELLDTIRWTFTQKEISVILAFVKTQLGQKDFLNSIVLVSGTDILTQTSLKEGEIIAPSPIPGN